VITDDAHDSPQQVALTGQAVVRQLSVLPASLALGGQPVGSADISTQQMVTVTNTGADPVDLAAFAVSPGFAIGSQTCSVGVLAPSASCTIGVYAAPSAVGPETGQLTISDNATGAPQAVALSAVGLGGLASLSTTSVDFGSVRVNSKSAPGTITLTNTGNIAVKVSKATLSGPNKGEYTITSETCQNQTVEPGASCQVVIIFRPESAGARPAILTLTDSALNSPQTVSLSGTGVSR
jgi:archaellum component FlaF (FlaF/FlaG flagellin family)